MVAKANPRHQTTVFEKNGNSKTSKTNGGERERTLEEENSPRETIRLEGKMWGVGGAAVNRPTRCTSMAKQYNCETRSGRETGGGWAARF